MARGKKGGGAKRGGKGKGAVVTTMNNPMRAMGRRGGGKRR